MPRPLRRGPGPGRSRCGTASQRARVAFNPSEPDGHPSDVTCFLSCGWWKLETQQSPCCAPLRDMLNNRLPIVKLGVYSRYRLGAADMLLIVDDDPSFLE